MKQQASTALDAIIASRLTALQRSNFRAKFALSGKDRDYIARRGLATIREHAFEFIRTRVAPALPKNDGRQTPMRGHPVFVAQHATATCCRGCAWKWHKLPKGRALNEKQVQFIVALIMGWIEQQLDEN